MLHTNDLVVTRLFSRMGWSSARKGHFKSLSVDSRARTCPSGLLRNKTDLLLGGWSMTELGSHIEVVLLSPWGPDQIVMHTRTVPSWATWDPGYQKDAGKDVGTWLCLMMGSSRA